MKFVHKEFEDTQDKLLRNEVIFILKKAKITWFKKYKKLNFCKL